jgi:hypothetical protein
MVDAQDYTEGAMTSQAVDAMAEHEENDFMSPSILEQVHVISRHGARTMLSRDADSLAESGGVTLTPLGQQQLYDLGRWLRNEYKDILNAGPTGVGDKSLEYYNPSLHRLESSNLDRTLSSANALAKGLFPGKMRASGSHKIDPSDPDYLDTVVFESPIEVPIPVYTTGQDHNDVTLRAYKNCPVFQDRLSKLYMSSEWKDLEFKFTDLLVELAKWFPEQAVGGMIPLKDVWNVYDNIHTARTECFDSVSSESCKAFFSSDHVMTAASALTSDQFARLEKLVEHAEFLKFGAGLDTDRSEGIVTAGPLTGSNLLWKILNRSEGDGDFFFYSAHFPTLLGFLSTLQASKDFFRETGGEKFFEYGSALIVEIHRSSEKGVRYFILKYKSSESDTAKNIIIKESTSGIQCGQDESGMPNIPKASWCLLEEVKTWADIYTLKSQEDWCKACNNKEADVCIANGNRPTSALDAWAANSESMGYTASPGATLVICSLFFGGFCAGALMITLLWWCSAPKINENKQLGVDASTSSYNSDGPDVIIGNNYGSAIMEGDMSAEQLNNKEIC